jgi:ferredoxin-NADP reductase
MSLHFTLRLATSRMIAPTVRHLAFERVDGQAPAFVPGQFLQVHFEVDGRALRRSYSIATLPEDPANPRGLIEIAVSYVEGGSATRLLSGLAEGETLEASGPYGRFVLHAEDANQRYLLIATGTGVTPYRAMLPLLRAQIAARGIEVALLLGARTPAELLYADEFRAFATATPGFRFHPCLSREGSAQPHADERRGRVQAMLAELAPDPVRDIAYLCGNPEMVDACFAVLKDAGLAIPVIRREKYVSPPDPKARSAGLAIVTE